MSRPIEEPVATQAGSVTTSTHPAFGQISVHRVKGSRVLYGSECQHQQYVSIEVRRSELKRDLSNDWHYERAELISVDLSFAQWSQFVSSMNVGEGTPCTINAIGGKLVPRLSPREQESDFRHEIRGKLRDSIDCLTRLRDRVGVDANGLSKARRDMLLAPIDKAIRELTENLPFVADQFDEHVERKMSESKVELHGYLSAVLHRAGVASLSAEPPVKLIEEEIDGRDA